MKRKSEPLETQESMIQEMTRLQPVRGTHDLLPDSMDIHRHIIDTARATTLCYGFREAATPIFEFSHVFERTLGDSSDVVTKEMYNFTDRGGESLTLRPENTAGLMRAFASNGLQQHSPVKFFYAGPMFRYERPQKGRMRQFHQIGAELIGVSHPTADIETIACGWAVLDRLGIGDQVSLELNSLGDEPSRDAYRHALTGYFRDHLNDLSEDSRQRLEKNPLRILDSKDEGDRMLVEQAPIFSDYLTPESQDFFQAICHGLEQLNIPYNVNQRLVRGLDYYCHTAFEFTTKALGAQGTVLAGGRYDGLMAQMGGTETPAIGWAAGVERLCLMIGEKAPPPPRPMAMIAWGEHAEKEAMIQMDKLRRSGFHISSSFGGNMKKKLKQANRENATMALILGEDELTRDMIICKNLETGHQEEIPLSRLEDFLHDKKERPIREN